MTNIEKENIKRKKDLFCDYDPIRGIGSLIKRNPLDLGNGVIVNIPIPMFSNPFVVQVKQKGINKKNYQALQLFSKIRYRYDFEYWAYTTVKIQNKKTKALLPFKLNRAQRKLLTYFEDLRVANKPINIDLVKSRQFGGSTLIQMYFAWIQTIHKNNWHSVVVADVESQAKGIRSMYKTFALYYNVDKLTLASFEGSSKNKIIQERGCQILIGSMQKPDSLRSTDNAMIHCSEIGLWKKTQGKAPEDLLQSLMASVPDNTPLTAFIRESTAKGVGNYWHRIYNTNDGFLKVFISWIDDTNLQLELDLNPDLFYSSLNEYELWLWGQGATLEGINWYRQKLKAFAGDTVRMRSEYPTTAEEAFQGTGRRFYPLSYVQQQRKFQCEPMFRGDMFADSMRGKEALNNVQFEAQANGQLQIWQKPLKSIEKYKNEYIVGVDIGGTTDKADWSTINVLSRIGLLEGGAVERVALWRGHIDQDLLAWKAAQIAQYYNNALLVVEVNSLNRDEVEGTESVNYLTVLNEIVKIYKNMYARLEIEKLGQTRPPQWGFHMNRATKPLVMNYKRTSMRDLDYIEYSREALDEADIIEVNNKGQIGAMEGAHDDIDVPTATALYVSSIIATPKEIITYKPNVNSAQRTEAMF
ncbi:hypothetical protein FACS1894153_4340 [Bacteroidia bacterium]|nr:hypothetical protein FACS1894153_4340 [Bacteroidia bacterium]